MDSRKQGSISDLIKATQYVEAMEQRNLKLYKEDLRRNMVLSSENDKNFREQVNFLRVNEDEGHIIDNFSNISEEESLGHSLGNYSADLRAIKPHYSYAQLISQAILSSHDVKLTLKKIYQFITSNYKYFNMNEKGWQNSIRHNLSLNKSFQKLPKSSEDMGKGSYWTITPDRMEEVRRTAYIKKKHKKIASNAVNSRPVKSQKEFYYEKQNFSSSCNFLDNPKVIPRRLSANFSLHNPHYCRQIISEKRNSLSPNPVVSTQKIIKQYYPLIVVDGTEDESVNKTDGTNYQGNAYENLNSNYDSPASFFTNESDLQNHPPYFPNSRNF